MTMRFIFVLAFCTVAFSAFAQDMDNQAELVVPAHDIARGSAITEGDLTTKSVPVLRMNESLIHTLADVVGKGEGFGEILVELEDAGEGAGDLRHLDGVGQAVAEVIG